MRQWNLTIIALALAVSGCSGRRPVHGPAPVRIAIEGVPALRACQLATSERFAIQDADRWRRSPPRFGERAVSVDLGAAAAEAIVAVLGEAFVVSDHDPDLVARPRIAAAQATRPRSSAGVQASITYGVAFASPGGDPVADVTGTGSGGFEYPLLLNTGRLLLHMGTLFLFEGIDSSYVYQRAFESAGAEAAAALRVALDEAPELRAYAAARRGGRQPASRDAEIDRLLDSVLARRPGTVAVLDIEPIAEAPTVVESYLAEELRTRLARKGVQTLERAALVHALEELQLNMTDLVDPMHAQRFGRLVAAEAILTGTTARFPHEVKLTLRLLATETGRVIGAGATRVSTDGAFPSPDGRPRSTAPAPSCPTAAEAIWVGPPAATAASHGWRSY